MAADLLHQIGPGHPAHAGTMQKPGGQHNADPIGEEQRGILEEITQLPVSPQGKRLFGIHGQDVIPRSLAATVSSTKPNAASMSITSTGASRMRIR